MAIDDKIKDEKLRFDIYREAEIILAPSSGKTDKYKYLTGKEILLSDQSRIIEQEKFTYSPLGEVFGKTYKNSWKTRKKQVETLEFLKPITPK